MPAHIVCLFLLVSGGFATTRQQFRFSIFASTGFLGSGDLFTRREKGILGMFPGKPSVLSARMLTGTSARHHFSKSPPMVGFPRRRWSFLWYHVFHAVDGSKKIRIIRLCSFYSRSFARWHQCGKDTTFRGLRSGDSPAPIRGRWWRLHSGLGWRRRVMLFCDFAFRRTGFGFVGFGYLRSFRSATTCTLFGLGGWRLLITTRLKRGLFLATLLFIDCWRSFGRSGLLLGLGLFFVFKRTWRSSLLDRFTLARRRILAHGFASQNLFLSHGQSNMDEKFIGENFSPAEEKPAAMHCFSCLMPLFVDMTATEMMCGGQREGSFSSFHTGYKPKDILRCSFILSKWLKLFHD